MRALAPVLSGLMLVLMPKCPLCLAAQVTLLTGAGLSATTAQHLHTALIIVFGGVALGAMTARWWKRLRALRCPAETHTTANNKSEFD